MTIYEQYELNGICPEYFDYLPKFALQLFISIVVLAISFYGMFVISLGIGIISAIALVWIIAILFIKSSLYSRAYISIVKITENSVNVKHANGDIEDIELGDYKNSSGTKNFIITSYTNQIISIDARKETIPSIDVVVEKVMLRATYKKTKNKAL